MQSSGLRHVYSQIKEQKLSEQRRKKTFPTSIYAENSVLFQRARASNLHPPLKEPKRRRYEAKKETERSQKGRKPRLEI